MIIDTFRKNINDLKLNKRMKLKEKSPFMNFSFQPNLHRFFWFFVPLYILIFLIIIPLYYQNANVCAETCFLSLLL